jgi:hypothetical protein
MASLELQCRANVQHCFFNQIFFLPPALVFLHCRLNFENIIIAISLKTLFLKFCEFQHFELESTLGYQVYLFVLLAVYSTLVSSNN